MSLMNEEMGTGQFSVTEIQHSTVTLSDGIQLALKVWLPCRKDELREVFPYFATQKQLEWSTELNLGSRSATIGDVFPVIMEYLPYSKDSVMTLERDHSRHSWFCSHGFVDIRVDIRGTGASEGLYYDEYDEQEFSDCMELIEWISSQPWSNKKVGMYGKSWGGFNGLQLAYKQPDSLKAVISLYSTDNRYSDDMHYEGNAIIGNGLLSWAGFMMVLNGRAPHPKCFDSLDEWKRVWSNRLQNASQSFLSTWLHHQHPNDPYWQHGSICENMSNIKCPVLVIGGHTDSYSSAAFRLAGKLNKYSRAIIGPWSHQWPDVSIPGPNIDYLNICLKWWTAYLKDESTLKKEVIAWPRLNLYLRETVTPKEIASSHNGKWVELRDWDARLNALSNYPDVEDTAGFLEQIFLGDDMKLLFEPTMHDAETVELKPHPMQGSGSGLWLSVDEGFPQDQNLANKHSHCWVSDVLEEDIVFAGLSKLFISLEAKTSGRYCILIRICDQFPTGESFLVTRGFQNLSEFGSGWVKDFPGGTKQTRCVNLKGVGHTVCCGHRLLVSITPTYFPIVYPSVNSNGLTIYPSETFLAFQTCNNVESKLSEFPAPKPLFKLPVNYKTPPVLSISDKCEDDRWIREHDEYSGIIDFPTKDFEYEYKCHEQYITDESVSYADISAYQSMGTTYTVEDNQRISTHVTTSQEMTGDKQVFRIKEKITVTIDGVEFFHKDWDNAVPRKYV